MYLKPIRAHIRKMNILFLKSLKIKFNLSLIKFCSTLAFLFSLISLMITDNLVLAKQHKSSICIPVLIDLQKQCKSKLGEFLGKALFISNKIDLVHVFLIRRSNRLILSLKIRKRVSSMFKVSNNGVVRICLFRPIMFLMSYLQLC